MGNRAVITTCSSLIKTGMYLHWNGGRASVEAFLAYCKMKGYRSPDQDCYGWAYLSGVVSNWFGNGMSVGVDSCEYLDTNNYDNGVYVIKDWLIIERVYAERNAEQDDYDLKEFIEDIDKAQPTRMQLTTEQWDTFEDIKKEIINARMVCTYKEK